MLAESSRKLWCQVCSRKEQTVMKKGLGGFIHSVLFLYELSCGLPFYELC